LFGDTFATKAASTLYLLENLNDTSPTAGTSLTENGDAFDFTIKSEDLPLRGYITPSFNGTNQYLSLPTEPKVEVGFGSFVASIWFKHDGLPAGNETLYQYGESTAITWRSFIGTDGKIRTALDDDTVSIFNIWESVVTDNKWHVATMVVDRDSNELSAFLDGKLQIDTNGDSIIDISTLTGTLTDTGVDFNIGAQNTVAVNFYTGKLANFSLYFPDTTGVLPPDYNIPSLVQAGIRESARQGTVVPSLDVGVSGQRINNRLFSNATADSDYFTSVVNVSEGFYDILFLNTQNTNVGITKIDIDGETYLTIDGNGALDRNVQTTVSGIFLTAGTHILKAKTDGTSGGGTDFAMSWAMIESSGVIVGDEILQRQNQVLAPAFSSNRSFANRMTSIDQDQAFTEGDLFLKKGLYKITYAYSQSASAGITDIFFGGVQVISADESEGTGEVYVVKQAFLEGGLTTIKVLQNGLGGGSSNVFRFVHLRFELVTGKSEGDTVNVFAVDQDFQVVSGNTPTLNRDQTANRFNIQLGINQPNQALNDEIIFPRYFSGGTYKIKYLSVNSVETGITQIRIDGTSVLEADQSSGSTVRNVEYFSTATISRGLHNVGVFNFADGGASDFGWTFTRVQFTKIATVENAEIDDSSDPVHGALVPLAKFEASNLTLTTFDIVMSVDWTKYSEMQIMLDTRTTGTSEIRLVINDLVTGYNQQGYSAIAGTVVGLVETALAHLLLASTNIITGSTRLKSKIDIQTVVGRPMGNINSLGEVVGVEQTGFGITSQINVEKLTFSLSANTFSDNTRVSVYGVKT